MSNLQTTKEKPVKTILHHATTLQKGATPQKSGTVKVKPQVTVRARLVSYPQKRQRAKAKRVEFVASQVVMFVILTVFAYGASTISGQVMVEMSRRQESKARSTTLGVLRSATMLRSHIDKLTDPKIIASWASEQKFIGTGEEPNASAQGRLALRD